MTDAFADALKDHYRHGHVVSWRDHSRMVVHCVCGASATMKEVALRPDLWDEAGRPGPHAAPVTRPRVPRIHEFCPFCRKWLTDSALFAKHVLGCGG